MTGLPKRSGRAITVAAAAVLALSTMGPAMAAEGEMMAPADPNTGKISLSAGVDFTTEYWFRGIFQEDQGFIAQPYVDVGINIFEADDFSMDVYFGNWNSLHSEDSTGTWYEADMYVGFAFGLPAGFSADLSYIVLYNPNGGDAFAEEIDLGFGYDDAPLWESAGLDFGGLQPSALFAFETNAGSDGDTTDEGVYFEFGIEPAFTVIDSADYPIDLSIPVTFGFSVDDYYEFAGPGEGDGLGFADVGLVASMPLAFMPSDYGDWSVSAGVHLLFLEGTLESVDDTQDDFHVYGSLGISFDY